MQALLASWLATRSLRKILLLRHGRIDLSTDEKRFIGQIDLPLDDVGKKQAAFWRSCMAPLSLGSIVASNLFRCRETARIIAGEKGRFETVDGLREINLGQWDGKPISEVKRRWPDAYRQRGLDMAGFRPPDGESFLDLKKRVVPAFEATIQSARSPLLIVTHAGVIRMILCHILGMPVENLFRIALGYGAMTLVDVQHNGYQVYAMNLLPDKR